MSDHKKPMSPELREALIRHWLPVDTPSQLADAFRQGWNASQRSRWISCEKELPPKISGNYSDRVWVLVDGHVFQGQYDGIGWTVEHSNRYWDNVTHWQPMNKPAPL